MLTLSSGHATGFPLQLPLPASPCSVGCPTITAHHKYDISDFIVTLQKPAYFLGFSHSPLEPLPRCRVARLKPWRGQPLWTPCFSPGLALSVPVQGRLSVLLCNVSRLIHSFILLTRDPPRSRHCVKFWGFRDRTGFLPLGPHRLGGGRQPVCCRDDTVSER